MEDKSDILTTPSAIKAAQDAMGKLDVLVCGDCHSVMHFVQEFEEHKKGGTCSKESKFRGYDANIAKSKVWAFLLWKDTQKDTKGPPSPTDDEKGSDWWLYQQWCKMDPMVRECWITAGKTIKSFTKISNATMEDLPRSQSNTEEKRLVRNGEDIKSEKILVAVTDKGSSRDERLKPSSKFAVNNAKVPDEDSSEEYLVEKILARRYNPKKKIHEFLLKWEGYDHDNNTWEPVDIVSKTCKKLVEEFTKTAQSNKKEMKGPQQIVKTLKTTPIIQKLVRVDHSTPGPSSASQAGRPMRSSKSKAMDQVKQWCGSMKDEENEALRKRKMEFGDSDSDENGVPTVKKIKPEFASDGEWTAESDEDKVHNRSDVIQQALNRANVQTNGSNRNITIGTKLNSSILGSNKPSNIANSKNIKVESKLGNFATGAYVMHRKDGVIKMDSVQSPKLTGKGSPVNQVNSAINNKTEIVRRTIVSSPLTNSTPVKVITKPHGTQYITQMKVVSKQSPMKFGGGMGGIQRYEPIKIQPKPDHNQIQQVCFVTTVPNTTGIQNRIRPTQTITQRTIDGRTIINKSSVAGTIPTNNILIASTSPRTQIRPQVPKQMNPQQKIITQKRITASTGASVVHMPTQLTSTPIRPKITVMNKQGNVIQKSAPSPTKILTRSPGLKPQSLISPQQKSIIAKKKPVDTSNIVGKALQKAGLSTSYKSPPKGRGKSANSNQSIGNKQKETKLIEGDGLHMEFHEVESDPSSEEEVTLPPIPEPVPTTGPESPPRQFTLCPLTGRIIGADGQPVEQPEAEPTPAPEPTPSSIVQVISVTPSSTGDTITSSPLQESSEADLSTLQSFTDNTGAMMRVEMSPGGTTGLIVPENSTADMPSISISDVNETNENTIVSSAAGGLPCLDDAIETPNPEPQAEPVNSSSASINAEVKIKLELTSSGAVIPASEATPTDTVAQIEDPSINTSLEISSLPNEPSNSESQEIPATVSSSPPKESAVSVENAPTVTDSIITNTETEDKQDPKTTEAKSIPEEQPSLVTITGEDGVVYQVTGHSENGQTLLVAQGADGEQQCVYVTTDQGGEGGILALDQNVAEAVAQLIPDQSNVAPQFYVKEGEEVSDENQLVMSVVPDPNAATPTAQEDGENQAQVVAQVIQADEPTAAGTRRVLLLLPDGNLMMTEVDEEQYAALELDK